MSKEKYVLEQNQNLTRDFFDKMRAKMPLGLYIRPGNLHSWKK